jgi:hypothetical protein
MPVRQIADGMLADLKPKPSPASVAASARSVLDMITKAATPVTKTMTDTPPSRATYKMRMNKFVAPGIDVGLDGQTMAYVKPDAKQARQIFASKYVPMTDGRELLRDCDKKTMSQRGYGNVQDSKLQTVSKTMRIGFNNTLVDTSNGKIVASHAPVIHHYNNAVKTDFPKGPGGAAPNKMWEDGTYEEMFAKVSKEYPAIPEKIKFKAPVDRRRKIFNLQAMTGAEVFGDAMLRKTLQDSFAEDRLAELKTAARKALPTATEEQIEQAAQGLRVARRQQEIARKLRLPENNPLVMAAAAAEVRAEQESKEETGAIAGNLAEQAEERHAVDVARVREGRRARAASGLVGLARAAIPGKVLGGAREAKAEREAAFRQLLGEKIGKGPSARSTFAPVGGRRATTAESAAVRREAPALVSAAAERREERRGGAGGPPPFVIEAPAGLTAASISKEPSAGRRGKGRPLGGELSLEEREAAKAQRQRGAREAAVGKRAAKSGELSAALRAAGLEPEEVFSSSSSSRKKSGRVDA